MNMQRWCKACVLLDGLNRGLPRLGITRTRGKGSENGIAVDEKKTNARRDKRTSSTTAIDF